MVSFIRSVVFWHISFGRRMRRRIITKIASYLWRQKISICCHLWDLRRSTHKMCVLLCIFYAYCLINLEIKNSKVNRNDQLSLKKQRNVCHCKSLPVLSALWRHWTARQLTIEKYPQTPLHGSMPDGFIRAPLMLYYWAIINCTESS